MAEINLADYDSTAVREASRKLKSCAQTLESGTRSRLRTIGNEISANMEGEAANALRQRVNELSSDISVLLNGITGLARALDKYASDLEATAQRLKRAMEQ